MKILFCILYYHPHNTGLTYYAQVLAEELARRGHQVTVLAARHSRDTPLGESSLNGLRVIRLWAPLRISRGLVMPAYPWRITRLLREHDIVHLHLPMLEAGLVAFLGRWLGLTVVATHHGDLVLPSGRFNRLIARIVTKICHFALRRSHAIFAYSQDYADHSTFLQPYRERVNCVLPPVSIPEPDAQRVAELRAQWRRDGGPLIGFSGRFVQEKRPDLLIRALSVINANYRNANIVFAGQYDIPYENTWRAHQGLLREYKSQLIFLGLMSSKQDLANFYAACDVLVLPSDTECFGLVQVEAMLCGTPVVMTDIPGGRVPVRLTGMGKLAKAGDWRAIGAAIVAILDDTKAYRKSRSEIAAVFNFANTIDQYEAVYQEREANHD